MAGGGGRGPAKTNQLTMPRQMQKQMKFRGDTVLRLSSALPVMCGIPTGAFQIRHRRGKLRVHVAVGSGPYDVARTMRHAARRCHARGESACDYTAFARALGEELHEQKRRDAIAAFTCILECLKRDMALIRVPQDFSPPLHKDQRIEVGGLQQAQEILGAISTSARSLRARDERSSPTASLSLLHGEPLQRFLGAREARDELLERTPLEKFCAE